MLHGICLVFGCLDAKSSLTRRNLTTHWHGKRRDLTELSNLTFVWEKHYLELHYYQVEKEKSRQRPCFSILDLAIFIEIHKSGKSDPATLITKENQPDSFFIRRSKIGKPFACIRSGARHRRYQLIPEAKPIAAGRVPTYNIRLKPRENVKWIRQRSLESFWRYWWKAHFISLYRFNKGWNLSKIFPKALYIILSMKIRRDSPSVSRGKVQWLRLSGAEKLP